ncbi:hypothetical protein PF011_g684 [Phytophthora fragariae]|uniref:FAR1 domain-containing protein n=1 Tax=Phytophthora fragariae TaxID=53985 RepID=A0A6A3MLM1_9STRA|nr:hypothetical protein PF011_g684 [Phytophthora fragariae]KAE9362229.1 hypothetical protein PF008_g255 [Phytophthora fragariae]
MELRPRAAQKRRLVAGSAIEADASDSSLDEEWQPPPGPSDTSADDECQQPPRLSAAESAEATSTTSDGAQQIHVACPPAQTKVFSSWQALETYLATYTAQTFQVFRRRSNTSVKERNARIDEKGSTATQIPDSWEQYSKTFVCTYHGKYTSQASGKRPRQESRKRGCGAKISACVQKVKGDSNAVEINMTRWCLEHNHRLAEFDYLQHPSNRISMDDETMGTVDELRKAGAKSTSILRFITDNSDSNPKPQDVQNLVRRLKLREEGKGPSNSGKRLKKWMAEFGEQPGNVGRIFVDTVNDKV